MTNPNVSSWTGKKILVVEDDSALREVICKIMQADGALVTSAENGLIAKNILDNKAPEFDLILSDVRMPELDGVALLKHVKATYPQIRVLIFTGFSEILESQEAFNLGADGFLAKPFRLADLKKAVHEILEAKPTETETPVETLLANALSFCRIRVEEFISTTRLSSDLYVRVADERFVKIAREGTEIQVGRIQTYKEKKVDFFYVRTQDFHKYTGLSLKLAHAAERTTTLTNEQKFKLYKHTTEVVLQQIMVAGLQPELTEAAESLVANTLSIVNENTDLLEMLSTMQSRGDFLYNHSWAVAMYSCLIATKMGWTSAQNQYKLSVAGLYHDLGLKELPTTLIEKTRVKMSPEEVRLYETHPTRGRDLLASVDGFPGDLAQIVFQHHETQIGTGYPLGCSGIKVHPLARVLHVAEEFCEKAFYQGRCKTVQDAAQVALEIFEYKGPELDAEALGALFDVFKVQRPPALARKKKLAG